MKKVAITVLFSLVSTSSIAGSFVFNYKNLNTLGALICDQNSKIPNKNEIKVNKFKTYKTKYGQSPNQIKYVLSGTCNATVDPKTKEVISFGDELELIIDLKQKNKATGKVGMNNIKVQFNNDKLRKVQFENIFDNEKKEISFSNTKWAKTDSLFSFNESDLIKVSKNKRVIASEKESNLFLNNGLTVYNIWNYQAYGCSGNNLTQDSCETYSESI